MSFDFHTLRFDLSQGQKLAVVAKEARYTWTEFAARVERMTGVLRSLGLPAGHPVLIRGQKEADFAVAILACMQCGLPYVPLDRIFPKDRVEKIRGILQSQVLIQCGEAEPIDVPVEITARDLSVRGRPMMPVSIETDASDPLVYIIFTSGSTGEPKGVQITRKNILDLLEWTASADFGFSGDDIFINQCSFSFDVSFFDLLAALHCGATLTLNAPEQIREPGEFSQRLAPLKPTVWVSTPSFLSLALLNKEFTAATLPELKRFYVAGEILHHSLVQRVYEKFPGAKMYNAYGPTEATVIITLVEASAELMAKYKSIPIGYVKAGSSIELMDTFESEGETVGELLLVGDNVARGYFAKPELTAEKFTTFKGRPAYRTGDHGYIKDGMVFFIGRIDNQVKLHGFRIEVDEIDAHIMNLPFVEMSLTVPQTRDGDVKRLVAFVKLRGAGADTAQALSEIKTYLEKKVPYYMVPGLFKFIDEFPYGASHKIDKKKLLASL